MANSTLDDLRRMIHECINRSDIDATECGDYYWETEPGKYFPCTDDPGIYAFMRNNDVAYIGKADRSTIGERLGTYVQQGKLLNPENWKLVPNYVITWKTSSGITATKLESCVLHKLNDAGIKPPDNDRMPDPV